MQFNYFDVQYTGESEPKPRDSSFRRENFISNTVGGIDYRGDTKRYPIDLGSYDKAHFVFFSIFEQRNTSYSSGKKAVANYTDTQNNTARYRKNAGGDVVGNAFKELEQMGTNVINTIVKGSAEQLKSSPVMGEVIRRMEESSVGQGVKSFAGELTSNLDPNSVDGTNILNQVTRITDSVALYMPDTLAFSYNQNYSDYSFGDLGLGLVAGSAISEIVNNKKSGIADVAKILGKNASPFVYAGLKKFLGQQAAGAIFQTATNKAVNPMLELLYTSPNFREFNLDFMFYPRSAKEAEEIYKIIRLFKFHQAPEVAQGSSGFFLVPPSLFDIDFYYGAFRNPNLPSLASCVLTRIDVDYAPAGWAAYEMNPDRAGQGFNYDTVPQIGKTGTPVATRMTLHFKETFIHTKDSFKNNLFNA